MRKDILLSMLAAGVAPVVAYADAPVSTLKFPATALVPGVPTQLQMEVVPGTYTVKPTANVDLKLTADGVTGTTIKVTRTTTLTVTAKQKAGTTPAALDVIVYLDINFDALRTKYLDEASRLEVRAKTAQQLLKDDAAIDPSAPGVKSKEESIDNTYSEIYNLVVELGNLKDDNEKAYEVYKTRKLYDDTNTELWDYITKTLDGKVKAAEDKASELIKKNAVCRDVKELKNNLTAQYNRWNAIRTTLSLGTTGDKKATNVEIEKYYSDILALINTYNGKAAVNATDKSSIQGKIDAFAAAMDAYETTIPALNNAKNRSGEIFVVMQKTLDNEKYAAWYEAVRGHYAEYAKIIQDAIQQNITTSVAALNAALAEIEAINTLYFNGDIDAAPADSDGLYVQNEKAYKNGMAAIITASAALLDVPAGATATGHNVTYVDPAKKTGATKTTGDWTLAHRDILALIAKEESKIQEAYDNNRALTAYDPELEDSEYSLASATSATNSLNALVNANISALNNVKAAIAALDWTAKKTAANEAVYYTNADDDDVTADGKYAVEEANVEALIGTVSSNAEKYFNLGKATDYTSNSLTDKYNLNTTSNLPKATAAVNDYVSKTAQAVTDYQTMAAYISGLNSGYTTLKGQVEDKNTGNGDVICYEGKQIGDAFYGWKYKNILDTWNQTIKGLEADLANAFAGSGYTGHVKALHDLLGKMKDASYYTFDYAKDKQKYYDDLQTTAQRVWDNVNNALASADGLLNDIQSLLDNNSGNLKATTNALKYEDTKFDVLKNRYASDKAAQQTAFDSVIAHDDITTDNAQEAITGLSPIVDAMNSLIPELSKLKSDLTDAIKIADANKAQENNLRNVAQDTGIAVFQTMDWSDISTIDLEKKASYEAKTRKTAPKGTFQTTWDKIDAALTAAFKAQTLSTGTAATAISNDLKDQIVALSNDIKALRTQMPKDNDNWTAYQAILTSDYYTAGSGKCIEDAIMSQKQLISAYVLGAAYELYNAELNGYKAEFEAMHKGTGAAATGSICEHYKNGAAVANKDADLKALKALLDKINGVIGKAQANEASYAAMKSKAESVKSALEAAEADIDKAANPSEKETYLDKLAGLWNRFVAEYEQGDSDEVVGGAIYDSWTKGTAQGYKATADRNLDEIKAEVDKLTSDWHVGFNRYAWDDIEAAKKAAAEQYEKSTLDISQYAQIGGKWNEIVAQTNKKIYTYAKTIEEEYNKAKEKYEEANKKGIDFDNAAYLQKLQDYKDQIIAIQAEFSWTVNTEAINAFETLKADVFADYAAAENAIKGYEKYSSCTNGTTQEHPWKEYLSDLTAKKDAVEIEVIDVAGQKLADGTQAKQATVNGKPEIDYNFAITYYGPASKVGSEAYLNALQADIAEALNNAAFAEWELKYNPVDNAIKGRENMESFDYAGAPDGYDPEAEIALYNEKVEEIKALNERANELKNAQDGSLAADIAQLKINLAAASDAASTIYNDALNVTSNSQANKVACEQFRTKIESVESSFAALKSYVGALYVEYEFDLSGIENNVKRANQLLADYRAKGGAANDTQKLSTLINCINASIVATQPKTNIVTDGAYLNVLKAEYDKLKYLVLELQRTYNESVGTLIYRDEYVKKIKDYQDVTLFNLQKTINAQGVFSTLESKKQACLDAELELGKLQTEIANLYAQENGKTAAQNMVASLETEINTVKGKVNAVSAAIEENGKVYAKYLEDADVKEVKDVLAANIATLDKIKGDINVNTVAMWDYKYRLMMKDIVDALTGLNSKQAARYAAHELNATRYDLLMAELNEWKEYTVDVYLANLKSFTTIPEWYDTVDLDENQEPIKAHTYYYAVYDRAVSVYNKQKDQLSTLKENVQINAATVVDYTGDDFREYGGEGNDYLLRLTAEAAFENAQSSVQELNDIEYKGLLNFISFKKAQGKELTKDYTNKINEMTKECYGAYRSLNMYNRDAFRKGYVYYDEYGDGINWGLDETTGGYDFLPVYVKYWSEAYDKVMARLAEIKAEIAELTSDEMVEANTYVVGDINADGKVNAVDYGYLLDYILGDLDADIVADIDGTAKRFEAVDFNGNLSLEIGDLTAVANIIRGVSAPLASARRAAAITRCNDQLALAAQANGNTTIYAISLSGVNTYAGAQLDVVLPEGAEFVSETLGGSAANMVLSASTQADGSRRFVLSSLEGAEISGSDAVLLVEVRGAEFIGVNNAMVSDAQGHVLHLAAAGKFADSIDSTEAADNGFMQKVYNVGGQLMNGLKKGLNIIVGNDGKASKVVNK